MEMDFVGAFELEYGWMVDFSIIITFSLLTLPHWSAKIAWMFNLLSAQTFA